jgi:hypothetical protein
MAVDVGNTNAPMGLRPVGTLGSAGYTGRVQTFATHTSDTTAIGIGDAVFVGTTASADGQLMVSRFTTGASTAIVGAVVGIVPDFSNLALAYRLGSTSTKVLVDTDPNTIYEIADSSTAQTTSLAVADVGLNILLASGTIDTSTGNSRTVLGTTVGTTTTMDCKLLGLSPKVGNLVGDYAKYQVKINRHLYSGFVTAL